MTRDADVSPVTVVMPARTHGRYLVVPPAAAGPAPLLAGFHGYAEGAQAQLDRLRATPGSDQWLVVSVQGLHRFYQRRTNDVVAGWMTSQDRELAMADNADYVAATLAHAGARWSVKPPLVFAGFSQGVAMAFRAAVTAPLQPSGVIAVGGDVPPELGPAALGRLPAVLICRGSRDEWYKPETFAEDIRRLQGSGVDVRPFEFEGGHEWSADVVAASAIFLRELRGA